jgi:hypothetical protein
MYNSLFWKDVGERLVATLAQVLIALLTASGFNLLEADFTAIAVTLATAGLLVVLKSLAAANVSSTVSPASLIKDDRGI